MARLKAFDLLSIGVVSAAGVWMGMRFFEPIVIDRLKKDGNLRTDIPVPEYDANGDPTDSKPMTELKDELIAIQQREKAQKAIEQSSSNST
ncbi:Ecm19p TDEL_0E01240 [Torulaspora delbrueckii]|uniref:Protein ECM19 n=1 Tax=Torulaspora delbrueckii TaxID=4950 RepID=G8ZUS3_TORDE|nr:hypothetical protein TDEL_0E01240 [Torulaspora delbrueckii]CCE92367.1 hypothetical protein TDEL_0E01240 [Torulaspora delbrueckii]